MMLEYLALVSTLITLALSCAFPRIFEMYLAPIIMIFCIAILGIPHGALDHILYSALELQKRSLVGQSESLREKLIPDEKDDESRLFRYQSAIVATCFYLNYLLIMCGWALLWYFNPDLAFWSFLVVSSYHFGEGDLGYLVGISPEFKTILYLSRGTLIVGLTMVSDPKVTLPIIQYLVDIPSDFFKILIDVVPLAVVVFHVGVLWRLACLCLFETSPSQDNHIKEEFPVWERRIQWKIVLYEGFRTVVYIVIFKLVNPLVGFAIFFGYWHSSTTIYNTIIYLKQQKASSGFSPMGATNGPLITIWDILWFYWLALPYTLVSFIGMAIVYGAHQYFDYQIEFNLIWATFIGCISILTGPHMVLLLSLHRRSTSFDLFIKLRSD